MKQRHAGLVNQGIEDRLQLIVVPTSGVGVHTKAIDGLIGLRAVNGHRRCARRARQQEQRIEESCDRSFHQECQQVVLAIDPMCTCRAEPL